MRIRDFGLSPGQLPAGTYNAITDVRNVQVGHGTLIHGDSIRTGVTAVLPHEHDLFMENVPAAVSTINGFGKAIGFEQVRELGRIETPILLTNTLNVGKVADALVSYVLRMHPDEVSISPLVGECNDSYLNDIQGRHVETEHVFAAIDRAHGAAIDEGCVGAGTGTSCYHFKGGIGTASRQAGEYMVGALLQTNFGARSELQIMGVPVGKQLPPESDTVPNTNDGSVMIVLATDAPLTARQLERLAHRAAFGIARTGTICQHGSGDFVIAFSTAYTLGVTSQTVTHLPDTNSIMNPLFQAVVESVEESVYNALVAAKTMSGRGGRTVPALPHGALRQLLRQYNRIF